MKKAQIIGFSALAALWLGLAVFAWCKPAADISQWERRKLAQMPTLTAKSLLSGSFMERFEEYSLDQFPLRDGFRQVKSLFHYKVLGQRDNNGIYITEGQAAQLEYPLDEASVQNALEKFQALYERYLAGTDSRILFCVVPDKGYYLAEANGYPAMDYGRLMELVEAGTPWAEPLDITGYLRGEDYYRTDTHWRQERLLGVAEAVCGAFSAAAPETADLTEAVAEEPFLGVYHGQAALPMEAEELRYLTGSTVEGCTVIHPDTGEVAPVYDLSKLESRDLYDIFLSGAQPLLRVENPTGPAGRELILFRDSFGSSLAPLLLSGYSRITLVDTRYISPALLGEYIDFHGQDVLFLYSTLVLNSSSALK